MNWQTVVLQCHLHLASGKGLRLNVKHYHGNIQLLCSRRLQDKATQILIVRLSSLLCQLSFSTSACFSPYCEDLINVTSRLTFSPTLLSFLNLLTQRLHYVTEPFAPSSVVLFFLLYAVETHNTWESAPRQNWMENWTLIITDGELAYPNPYRAKLFPPPASFITARTLVHSTSGLPWDFCFTSCFLCYVPRNNGIQS